MNKVKFCTSLNIIDFNKPHTGWTSIPSVIAGSMAYQNSANRVQVFEKYEFLMGLLQPLMIKKFDRTLATLGVPCSLDKYITTTLFCYTEWVCLRITKLPLSLADFVV
jgi:hypothetical protein